MRMLLTTLTMLVFTQATEPLSSWAVETVERTWELTLIKVDGEFIDLDEPDWRFYTRNDCMRDGIYRMQWALDNQREALRTDRGSVATYTQYLGFICEYVKELAK